MISQKQAIKTHLQQFSSITSKEAWSKYGITRLSSIILRLRKTEMEIISIPQKNGRFNWVRYRLIRVNKKLSKKIIKENIQEKNTTKVHTEFEVDLIR